MSSDSDNVSELREAILLDPLNPALYMRLGQLLSRSGLYSCTQGDEVYHPFEQCRRFCCARWAYQKARLHAPDDESVKEALRTYRDPERHREGQKAARLELISDSERLRAGAAYYLGLVGDEEDLPKLVSMLGEKELDFSHLGVLRGLGNMALPDSSGAILKSIRTFRRSGHLRHFQEVIYATGGIADEANEAAILDILRKDRSYVPGVELPNTLMLIGGESSFRFISENFDEFYAVIDNAVLTAYILEPVKTREMMVRMIKEILEEVDTSYRKWESKRIIRAFHIISEPEDTEYLIPLLDKPFTLAREAMIVLAAMKTPEAGDILDKLLRSSDHEIYSAPTFQRMNRMRVL
jgi:hypothetical protein